MHQVEISELLASVLSILHFDVLSQEKFLFKKFRTGLFSYFSLLGRFDLSHCGIRMNYVVLLQSRRKLGNQEGTICVDIKLKSLTSNLGQHLGHGFTGI